MSSTQVIENEDNDKTDDTLIIIVNGDGTLTVDPHTLEKVLANQSRATVSVIRIDNPPLPDSQAENHKNYDGSDHSSSLEGTRVNLTVEGFYPPPQSSVQSSILSSLASQLISLSSSRDKSEEKMLSNSVEADNTISSTVSTPLSCFSPSNDAVTSAPSCRMLTSSSYAKTNITSDMFNSSVIDGGLGDSLGDAFSDMDSEQIKRLENALHSEKAKQILGDEMTSMLGGILASDKSDNLPTEVQNNVQFDHCYTVLYSEVDEHGNVKNIEGDDNIEIETIGLPSALDDDYETGGDNIQTNHSECSPHSPVEDEYVASDSTSREMKYTTDNFEKLNVNDERIENIVVNKRNVIRQKYSEKPVTIIKQRKKHDYNNDAPSRFGQAFNSLNASNAEGVNEFNRGKHTAATSRASLMRRGRGKFIQTKLQFNRSQDAYTIEEVSSSSNEKDKSFKTNYDKPRDLQNYSSDDKRRKDENSRKSDDPPNCSTPVAKEIDIDDQLSLEAVSVIEQCTGLDLEINAYSPEPPNDNKCAYENEMRLTNSIFGQFKLEAPDILPKKDNNVTLQKSDDTIAVKKPNDTDNQLFSITETVINQCSGVNFVFNDVDENDDNCELLSDNESWRNRSSLSSNARSKSTGNSLVSNYDTDNPQKLIRNAIVKSKEIDPSQHVNKLNRNVVISSGPNSRKEQNPVIVKICRSGKNKKLEGSRNLNSESDQRVIIKTSRSVISKMASHTSNNVLGSTADNPKLKSSVEENDGNTALSVDADLKRRRQNRNRRNTRLHEEGDFVDGSQHRDVTQMQENDDDPNKLWCICHKPHNNRFMICCDSCDNWFHGFCVGISKSMGEKMEQDGTEWLCPSCKKEKTLKEREAKQKLRTRSSSAVMKRKHLPAENISSSSDDVIVNTSKSTDDYASTVVTNHVQTTSTVVHKSAPSTPSVATSSKTLTIATPIADDQSRTKSSNEPFKMMCTVCKKFIDKPNTIYCDEDCIDQHVKQSLSIIGRDQRKQHHHSEKLIVCERKTRRLIAGASAPSIGNVKVWLMQHPTFEIVVPHSTNSSIKSVVPRDKLSETTTLKIPLKRQTSISKHFSLKRTTTGGETVTKDGKDKLVSSKNIENIEIASTKHRDSTYSDNGKMLKGAEQVENNMKIETTSDDNAKEQDNNKETAARKSIKTKQMISFEEALTRGGGKSKPDTTRKNSGRQIMLIPVQPAPTQSTATTKNAKHHQQQALEGQSSKQQQSSSSSTVTKKRKYSDNEKRGRESPAQTAVKKQDRKLESNKTTAVDDDDDETITRTSPKDYSDRTTADSSSKPAAKRDPVRASVQKSLRELLTSRLQETTEVKLTEQEVTKLADEIEEELHSLFKDTGMKYKSKYRSLLFNIKDKKNTLFLKIAQKSISSYDLVRLTPEELASQELAQWRQREAKHEIDMIKKSELELLSQAKTYVVKTHKGEQEIETDDHKVSKSSDIVPDLKAALEGSGDVIYDIEDRRDILHKKGPSYYFKDKDKYITTTMTFSNNSATIISDSVNDQADGKNIDNKESKSKKHRHHYDERDSSSSSRRKKHDRKHKHKHKKRASSNSSSSSSRRRRRRSSERSVDRRSTSSDDDDECGKKNRRKKRNRDKKERRNHRQNRYEKYSEEKDDKTEKIFLPPVSSSEEPILEEDRRDDDYNDDDSYDIVNDDYDDTMPVWNEEFNDGLDLDDIEQPDMEPSSTTMIVTPPYISDSPADGDISPLWRGNVIMPDVAKFYAYIKEVSGNCQGLENELADEIECVGRINPKIVWEYIGKLKKSGHKDIMIVRFEVNELDHKVDYLGLYAYLNNKNRMAVIGNKSSGIKDFYLFPLPNHSPIPQVLLPIDGPGFGDHRSHLLLGIIIRPRRSHKTSSLSSRIAKEISSSSSYSLVPPGEESYTPPCSPSYGYSSGGIPDLSTTPPLPAPSCVNEPYSPGEKIPYSPGALLQAESAVNNDAEVDVDLQQQMDELNRKIAEEKRLIKDMSCSIINETTLPRKLADEHDGNDGRVTDNIKLPSNIQLILDSIKKRSSNEAPSSVVADPIVSAYKEHIEAPYSPGQNAIVDEEDENIEDIAFPPTLNSDIPTTYMSVGTTPPLPPAIVIGDGNSTIDASHVFQQSATIVNSINRDPRQRSNNFDVQTSSVDSSMTEVTVNNSVIMQPPPPGVDDDYAATQQSNDTNLLYSHIPPEMIYASSVITSSGSAVENCYANYAMANMGMPFDPMAASSQMFMSHAMFTQPPPIPVYQPHPSPDVLQSSIYPQPQQPSVIPQPSVPSLSCQPPIPGLQSIADIPTPPLPLQPAPIVPPSIADVSAVSVTAAYFTQQQQQQQMQQEQVQITSPAVEGTFPVINQQMISQSIDFSNVSSEIPLPPGDGCRSSMTPPPLHDAHSVPSESNEERNSGRSDDDNRRQSMLKRKRKYSDDSNRSEFHEKHQRRYFNDDRSGRNRDNIGGYHKNNNNRFRNFNNKNSFYNRQQSTGGYWRGVGGSVPGGGNQKNNFSRGANRQQNRGEWSGSGSGGSYHRRTVRDEWDKEIRNFEIEQRERSEHFKKLNQRKYNR